MSASGKCTDRQRQVLRAIHAHVEKYARPPTVRELCEVVPRASVTYIQKTLDVLHSKGLLEREMGTSRGLRITTEGYAELGIRPPAGPEALVIASTQVTLEEMVAKSRAETMMLGELARNQARKMLACAMEQEAEEALARDE